MMSLTFGLFTQVSGSGPLGTLVVGHCDLQGPVILPSISGSISQISIIFCVLV